MEVTYRLGVAAESYLGDFTADEILQGIHDLGVTWIQLDPRMLPGGLEMTVDQARGFHATLHEYGLVGESLSFWSASDADQYVGDIHRLLDLAEPLGFRLLNLYYGPFKKTADAAGKNDLEIWREKAQTILDRAAEQQITLVLEPEAHDRSATCRGCLEILEATRFHPALGINYDPCNLLQAGDDPFPGSYTVLKQYIRYCHLKNGYRTPDTEPSRFVYTWIDRGAVNAQGVLLQLAEDGYDGLVVLEPHMRDINERLACLAYEVKYIKRETQYIGEAVTV
ncbi:MAG TPA: sugar phosphate isomerase/epimerase family protein [Armatimonadota bacterium]|jgi:sugar phosphate isomerase/epimerase